jgi:predicted nucleotidyltransferase
LSTLADLVFATGLQLEVTVRPQPRPIDRLTGPLARRVRRHRRRLVKVAVQHGVTHLRAFGSVARGEDSENCDLDVFVDLVPGEGLEPDLAARVEQDLVAL